MTINRTLFFIFTSLITLLFALLLTLVWLSDTRARIAFKEHQRYESYLLADELRQSSDDLTKMARLYAATGDEIFLEYFNEIADIRDGHVPRPQNYARVYWDLVIGQNGARPGEYGEAKALKELMINQGFTLEEFSKLSEAETNSNKLIGLEMVAMNAIKGKFADNLGGFLRQGEPDFELARNIMFGNKYLAAKAEIMGSINQFFDLIDRRTQSEVAALRSLGGTLMSAALLISLASVILCLSSIVILQRKVLKPLTLLSNATEKVGQGDYAHQIDHRSNDEMGNLVSAFNNMVVDTRESVAALHTTNQQLKENQEALEEEKQVSENLLLNILPSVIAERLRGGEMTIADEFPEVSVMFADLVNFTELAEVLGPKDLVKLLNDVFALFDKRLDEFGLEKIKTIGDCYMVVAGVPKPVADHAQRLASFALVIVNDLAQFVEKRGLKIKVRIGLHSGTAVAGVVGTKKFAYDLWGDVVNVASRMESTGTPGMIHVSQAFMSRLQDSFTFSERGDIQVKGKGPMTTYFLESRRYS